MRVAHNVLFALGATEVSGVDTHDDPETEAEFNALRFVSPTPISWDAYTAKYNEVLTTKIARHLRVERARLLAKTDWVMTVDNVQTLANKDEWIAYRQLLRDLPANPPSTIEWTALGNIDFTRTPLPTPPPILRITPEVSPQSSESTPPTLPTPPPPEEPPAASPEPQPQPSSEYAPAPAATEA